MSCQVHHNRRTIPKGTSGDYVEMNKHFGVMSTGFKDTGELILTVKEAKRVKHLLHYLSVTGQLRVTDFLFLECISEHIDCLTGKIKK